MLQILYKLQKLEAQEQALLTSQKNSEEYRLLRELKAEFERLKQALLERQDELNALQREMESLPGELAEISDKLATERTALYDGSVGNLREFNARHSQISTLEERHAAISATLTEKQNDLRRLMRQAKLLQQRLSDQHQLFTKQYQQFESLREGWQSALKLLAADKEVLLADLTQQDVDWYEQQKPLFAGLPVAQLAENHVCSGCRTVVTPMLYKRTVNGERTRCEKCGRYLFIEPSVADAP